MSGREPRRWARRAGWSVGLATVLVAAVVAGGCLFVRSRDSVTVVPLGDALDEFRATDASGPHAPRRPEPGVYLYDTVGEERVDALGGTTHVYPAETTMTITPTDCGYQARWDALRERWDELNLCENEVGESIDSARQFREFFGFANDRTYDCDDKTLVRVHDAPPGDRRVSLCWYGESTNETVVTFIGVEDIVVGGTTVPALHIRVDNSLRGDVRGRSELDYWADPATTLILRRQSNVVTDADSPLGSTRYEETYTIQLRSLEPRT